MKVLILGHTGMLGDAVFRHFSNAGQEISTLPEGMRWPSPEMQQFIKNSPGDWIINCIGAIPQRKPLDHEFFSLNARLPFFLFSLPDKMIIHAATDCEFSGKISEERFYQESDYLDATDIYGMSKAIPAEFIRNAGLPNIKMIRASIIGFERSSSLSLLSWFLAATDRGEVVRGFNNHFWNGITTLEWAKIALSIVKGEQKDNIVQVATEKISKFTLLNRMAEGFRPGYQIQEASHPNYHNKCLATKYGAGKIEIMLKELKGFYQHEKA